MDFKINRLSDYSNESLIAELRRVAELVKFEPITRQLFAKHSKASTSTFIRRFGGWQQALESAGLGDRYSGKTVSERMRSQSGRNVTRDQVLNELRRVAGKVGHNDITCEEFNAHSTFSAATVRSRFKTWCKALSAAELVSRATSVRYSDEECFENLLRVWTYYGRQPKYREMNNEPSEVGGKAYVVRWGTWVKSLEAFVDRVQKDEPETYVNPKPTSSLDVLSPPKTKRKSKEDDGRIPLGVRYKILVRDSFKCVRCGHSPATDPNCRLHVDHKIPYSKGGPTVIENLRTL